MRIASLGALGLILALPASAYAMGGQGGPHDNLASPYALYAPQSFPPPSWTVDNGAVEGRAVYVGRPAPHCSGERCMRQ
ncbi:MAG TPA: hypothetical protein VKS78_08000 [Roseiarcus sp.]|nr:hypothetical protein [Roseiarcus sp.]